MFDENGNLVLPRDIVKEWEAEKNIIVCPHCGYHYVSHAIYKIRHVCPKCREVFK